MRNRASRGAHRVFAGFWGILGETESLLSVMYRQRSDIGDTRNHFNWLPILMWIEAFVTVVFLVNLMSAFPASQNPHAGYRQPRCVSSHAPHVCTR
jgi:hypothetical protein